jgi:hypothetical protein
MIKVGVKFSPRFKGPKSRARKLAKIFQRTGAQIERRIIQRNVDADGKRLPPLSGDSTYFAAGKDKRFSNPESVRNINTAKGGSAGDGKSQKTKLYKGYASAKQRSGALPQRDGRLTGSLWDSLTVLFTKTKPTKKAPNGALRMKLLFSGSDKKQKYTVDGTTKSGKPRRKSLRQRVKAERLMFTERNPDGSPTGKQAFLLLEPSQYEMRVFITQMLEDIRVVNRDTSTGF